MQPVSSPPALAAQLDEPAESAPLGAADSDERAIAAAGGRVGPRRQSRTWRDMALSLVVLLIPIALVVVVFRAKGGNDVVVVDPAPVIAEARAAAGFPVAVPGPLPAGWKTVSATFDRGEAPAATLRLGYLTPGGGGLQLLESNAAVDGLLIRELGDQTRPTGVATVGAGSWNSYDVRAGEHALVQPSSSRTIIVIGAADLAELTQLAASLG